MTCSPLLVTKLNAVRTELLAAEKAHPGSRNLKLLHARMTEALDQAQRDGILPEQQYSTLGGGTPKTPNAE